MLKVTIADFPSGSLSSHVATEDFSPTADRQTGSWREPQHRSLKPFHCYYEGKTDELTSRQWTQHLWNRPANVFSIKTSPNRGLWVCKTGVLMALTDWLISILWTLLNEEKQRKLELFLSQIWASTHTFFHTVGIHRLNPEALQQHLQTCILFSRGIIAQSIISKLEGCYCVMWGNMTTAVGKRGRWWWSKREEKQTESQTSAPGFTLCGFAEMADFDVNMYLWFYRSE